MVINNILLESFTMRNIMIDTETLGVRSSSVIISIGAVPFDDAAIGPGFYQRVDIQSCLDVGLTVDASTIEWWMTQSDEARAAFDEKGVPLRAALNRLSELFEGSELVWANGVNFDVPILENAYHACGMVVPWKFYNTRDYRTVKNMFPKEFLNSLRVEPVVAHNALDDARAQALTLQAIWDAQRAPAGKAAA